MRRRAMRGFGVPERDGAIGEVAAFWARGTVGRDDTVAGAREAPQRWHALQVGGTKY